MFFYCEQNDYGHYKDANDVKFMVLWGREIYRPHKAKNEDCEEFETLEDALEAHGLVKIERENPRLHPEFEVPASEAPAPEAPEA